jgi:hypothetical protein
MAEEMPKTEPTSAGAISAAKAAAEEPTSTEKRLIEQRREINAALRAERSSNKLKARKLRNRRSVLTGLAIIDWIETRKSSPAFAEEVQRARDKWLNKSDERALFGLPPRLELVTPRRRKTKAKPGAAENGAGASAALSDNSADATTPPPADSKTGSA